jgi:SAM-dependent methyltransferase
MENVIKHYDALSRWGQKPDEANRHRIEETLGLVPIDAHLALDLGCGDGTVSNPLVDRGVDVVGVDISLTALQYFEGKAVIARVDRLPFPDRSFDLVLCAETLEHLPAGPFEATLHEIERVAGQHIIVTTPNKEYLPASFARCERCGTVYHQYLHTRSIDRAAHANLFRDFVLVKTIDILRWRHNPCLVSVEHNLLRVYSFRKGLLCPHCGHITAERPQVRLWKKALLKGLRQTVRVLPMGTKARWIASLYRRNESQAESCCWPH